jgi:hypothetical protein
VSRPVLARASLVALAVASASLWPGGLARATENDPCLSAPVEGQELQKAGRLIEAHARFVTCGSKSCPAEIVQDCSRWVSEVEAATPSIVVEARDGQGHELSDVRVSIDGQPAVSPGALAILLDPGVHKFVFLRSGYPDVVDQAVLHEGEKNRPVLATYPSPKAAGGAPSGADAGVSRPVPAAAWVSSGISVAGFALFATFGALGLSERNSDHCNTGCDQSQKSDVDVKYTVADVGLGVGVVALGVAAWQFFARPSAPPSTSAVRVSPTRGGGAAAWETRF